MKLTTSNPGCRAAERGPQATPLGSRLGESGSALVITLLLLAAITIVGGAFLSLALTERSISGNLSDSSAAFEVAEAGLALAKADLPNQDVDSILGSGGVLYNGQALGDGTYTVTLSNNVSPTFPRGGIPADPGGATVNSDQYVVVTSVGSKGNARRAVEAIFEQSAGGTAPGPFDRLLSFDAKLKTSGSGVFTGPVHCNGDVENGNTIMGDVTAGGIVADHSQVTGTVTEGVPTVTFPDVACPSIPYGPAPIGAGVSFSADKGELSMSGGDDTLFNSGTYYFTKFMKSGGGNIVVPAGGQVKIYVSGQFAASGGGWMNGSNSAGSLQVWSCGGNTRDFSFSGDTLSYVAIYAPLSKLQISGPGDKFGAFIGKEFSKSGSSAMSYDPTSNGMAAAAVKGFVPGTWTERPL